MRTCWRAWLAAALVLVCRVGWSWNAEGHMVVAQLAYNHLDPFAKAQCDSLIAVQLPDADTRSTTL